MPDNDMRAQSMSHPGLTGRKRKQRETEEMTSTFDDDVEDKKRKPNSANTSSSRILSLQQHLDFSAHKSASSIQQRADVVAEALLHDFRLVVRREDAAEVEHEILELEFYLWKDGCHEDPFTHGSEEQKIPGQWYFHRAPRRSTDSRQSLTSLSGYRGGTRKGMDLTIAGSPLSIASPYFTSPSLLATAPRTRGGILLRSLRRTSDDKIISGPSLLVDHILMLSGSLTISDLVEQKWGRDISAFRDDSGGDLSTVSMYLRPTPGSRNDKPTVYRSPRIGLDLSQPGTTSSTTHPRLVFLSKPYRYFVHPELLTANGRAQTFLGVFQSCLASPKHGGDIQSVLLKHDIAAITGLKENTVSKYLEDYQAGLNEGNISRFIGAAGKGASASPAKYLRMMGALEAMQESETIS